MNCPRCADALLPTRYEDADIHTCESCGGEFVPSDALRHIIETRAVDCASELDAQDHAAVQDRRPTFGVPDSERHQHADCPACEQPMVVGNYFGDSGIFVDRCDGCGGVWLDRAELEQVQLLMERWQDEAPDQVKQIAGNLETERRRVAERTSNTFQASRFSFVNALINRFLDAG